eukprot:TRINITY_DN18620_c0_g1_i3.p1 TRINITY_DN18620_c0_g1~~TRINITY_DN18620_c0_g1_i3.p1  ORF type:complete len:209 (-),score=15.49 TRINITY_DN18620_c0_g1_i3:445-1071(-)
MTVGFDVDGVLHRSVYYGTATKDGLTLQHGHMQKDIERSGKYEELVLNPHALERIAFHQKNGDKVEVISASGHRPKLVLEKHARILKKTYGWTTVTEDPDMFHSSKGQNKNRVLEARKIEVFCDDSTEVLYNIWRSTHNNRTNLPSLKLVYRVFPLPGHGDGIFELVAKRDEDTHEWWWDKRLGLELRSEEYPDSEPKETGAVSDTTS